MQFCAERTQFHPNRSQELHRRGWSPRRFWLPLARQRVRAEIATETPNSGVSSPAGRLPAGVGFQAVFSCGDARGRQEACQKMIRQEITLDETSSDDPRGDTAHRDFPTWLPGHSNMPPPPLT